MISMLLFQIDLAQSPAKSNANNQAVLSSEDESDETITFGPKPLSEDLATTRSEGKLSGNTNTSSSPNMQMSMNADISMSDFDISLTGVPVSNSKSRVFFSTYSYSSWNT